MELPLSSARRSFLVSLHVESMEENVNVGVPMSSPCGAPEPLKRMLFDDLAQGPANLDRDDVVDRGLHNFFLLLALGPGLGLPYLY